MVRNTLPWLLMLECHLFFSKQVIQSDQCFRVTTSRELPSNEILWGPLQSSRGLTKELDFVQKAGFLLPKDQNHGFQGTPIMCTLKSMFFGWKTTWRGPEKNYQLTACLPWFYCSENRGGVSGPSAELIAWPPSLLNPLVTSVPLLIRSPFINRSLWQESLKSKLNKM